MGLAIRLALRAAIFNWKQVTLGAIALAAVLTPLLLLYAIKSGIVGGLLDELKKDPNILAVTVRGHSVLTREDIDEIRAMKEVGFAIGSIRSISSRMLFYQTGENGKVERADVAPTETGDPLVPAGQSLENDGEIFLSSELAEVLGSRVGDAVTGYIVRGDDAELSFDFVVRGVIGEAVLSGKKALVKPLVLEQLEQFLEGYSVLAKGIDGKPESERPHTFSRLRLYAATLDDVHALDDLLEKRGLSPASNAADIEWVKQLDRAMTFVFAVIGVASLAGYLISVSTSLSQIFKMIRPDLGMLRLLGLNEGGMRIFPFVFALVITLGGLVIATVSFMLLSEVLDFAFRDEMALTSLTTLELKDYLIACAATFIILFAVSFRLARGISQISPTEVIKE